MLGTAGADELLRRCESIIPQGIQPREFGGKWPREYPLGDLHLPPGPEAHPRAEGLEHARLGVAAVEADGAKSRRAREESFEAIVHGVVKNSGEGTQRPHERSKSAGERKRRAQFIAEYFKLMIKNSFLFFVFPSPSILCNIKLEAN